MFLICIFVAGLEVKNGMLFFIRQCLQNPHIYRKWEIFLSNSSLCWLIRESTIFSKFPVIDTVVSAAALY